MDRLRKFSSFQAVDFGRTVVISFQLLPLVLGGRGYRRRKRHKIQVEIIGIDVQLG